MIGAPVVVWGCKHASINALDDRDAWINELDDGDARLQNTIPPQPLLLLLLHQCLRLIVRHNHQLVSQSRLLLHAYTVL